MIAADKHDEVFPCEFSFFMHFFDLRGNPERFDLPLIHVGKGFLLFQFIQEQGLKMDRFLDSLLPGTADADTVLCTVRT